MILDVPLERLRLRRSVKWRMFGPDVLPLFIAEMDVDLAPPVQELLSGMMRESDTGYAWPVALPESYAGFARRRWNLEVDPAHVYVLQDVMRGVLELLVAGTEEGDGVVVNPPVYQPFFATVEHARRRVVEVPLLFDADGTARLDLDGLDAAFRAGAKAYLLCSPHNPVGRAWTPEELTAVAEVADRHGVLVLVDEIHAPLVHAPHRHVPFGSLDVAAARDSLSLVSASKAWNLAGLKAALVVASSGRGWSVVERMGVEVGYGTGILGAEAARVCFDEGEPWLDQLLVELADRRRLLGELLAEQLPAVRLRPPDATFLAWLDCRDLGPADPRQTFFDRGRVALEPGPRFGTGGAGFARINFATSGQILTEAVQRMARAVAAVAGGDDLAGSRAVPA